MKKQKSFKKLRAMTLPEVLMAVGISTVVLAMTATTVLAGVKLTQKINNINGNDASLRIAYTQMVREIREAVTPPTLSGGADATGYSTMTYTVQGREDRSFSIVGGQLIWRSVTNATQKVIARDVLTAMPFKYDPNNRSRVVTSFQLGRDAQSYSGQARTVGVLTYQSHVASSAGRGSEDIPPVEEFTPIRPPNNSGRGSQNVGPTQTVIGGDI